MKLHELQNIEVENINSWDAPDYVDAFISYAEIDGRPLTDDELDVVNDNDEFVYECVMEWLQ